MTPMRTTLLITALPALLAYPAGAVDFVRQIQLINGRNIVYDIPVGSKKGELLSKPIQGDGAIFQLYAYSDPVYSPYSVLDLNAGSTINANVSLDSHLVDLNILGMHLDITLGGDNSDQALPKQVAEKYVGAYIPEAVIVIQSLDPHRPPRTRADQPYSVSVMVRKLPDPGIEIPMGAPSKVVLRRDYKLYHPVLHIPSENGSGQGTYDEAFELSRNGSYLMPGVVQNLPGQEPTKVIGEETHSAYVAVDEGGKLAKIASATIQIWPVASAEIIGVPAGARFTNIPQNLETIFINPYPQSHTCARIYKTADPAPSARHIILSSETRLNEHAPPSHPLRRPLMNLEEAIDEDGEYTIEVVTVTPFDDGEPVILAEVSFEIDRILKVNGSLNFMEP